MSTRKHIEDCECPYCKPPVKNPNEHPGSRDMYDTIAQWSACPIVISVAMVWNRMGILGILGDYVLNYTPGDIVEIGVGESSIFLTKLARKFGRVVYHCDLQRGHIVNMTTVPGILDSSGVSYIGKSDDFFKEVEFSSIALGFIDGDHTYEQVKKDFENLFDLLVEGGYIFLHDTYPPNEDYLPENRCGDVYRFRQELEDRSNFYRENIDVFTFPFGAMDVGLTMVRKLPRKRPHFRR